MYSAEEESTLSLSAFSARNYTSLAALVFLILDHLTGCKSEYKYIWRSLIFTRASSSVIGLLYIWARYSALITMIGHYALVRVLLAKGSVPEMQCRTWFLSLFMSMASQMLVLDAILFLRVYALHCKDKKILFLIVPIIAQFTPATVTFWSILRQSTFDYKCDFRNPKQLQFALQGVTVIFAHASLWAASFAKRNIGRGPCVALVKMVVHEGLWAFVLLLAIVSGVVSPSFVLRSANPFIIFV
ncbi:hypothetical protein HYPSUDRAFT_461693 [Hypholoma sublateritium FD-334 SS-4]|uniref:DUF6533 domain-containing protein n=1 Tax=Hypholoma sublateritium (strain FD-334 SS-4) TaxID=945553 RepID=A0A0D2NC69_HYPSF|nr:hypothetical protein HYPSUDRAFT_461693 [Hypholoma sublateritium FD-334 SS-4]